jgi:uncharacterized protein YkwD
MFSWTSILVGDSVFNLSSAFRYQYADNLKWEEYILGEVNRLRAQKGCCELKLNRKAQAAAREHSLDMARLGYFSHRDLDGHTLGNRLRKAKFLNWETVAENIAKCDGSSPARQAMYGWLGSAVHLRNILNPQFTETGVGAVLDSDGSVLFCQIFLVR